MTDHKPYTPPAIPEYFGDRLYNVWRGMLSRCYNPNTKGYHRYGGRGISVCDEWRTSFEAFKTWALEAGYDYAKDRREQTIDRTNNNGNYEPMNCRWVSLAENNRNREWSGRKPKPKPEKKPRELISWEIGGVTKTAVDWCKEYGANYSSVMSRVRRGMRPSKALTYEGGQYRYSRYYWRKPKKSSPSTVQVNELL